MTAPTTSLAGWADIVESFRRVQLWTTLGWYDFTSRYRRTFIGPLWQTFIVAIWVAGLNYVFGTLLQKGGGDYPAYLAIGIVLWNYLLSTLAASPNLFVRNSKLIFVVNNPLYTYALRQIVENLMRLGFQALVFVALLPWMPIAYGPGMLMAIPGMVLILILSLWLVPLMAVAGARIRDLSFALTSVMRFLFFTTPVFWRSDDLGQRAYIANFNPFTHFLEIVRAPLLGGSASQLSWTVAIAINLCGILVTFVLYNHFRKRIVFWL